MPLGHQVSYLVDKIMQESRLLDDLLWDGLSEDDFRLIRTKRHLKHLTTLHEQGEEYYVEF